MLLAHFFVKCQGLLWVTVVRVVVAATLFFLFIDLYVICFLALVHFLPQLVQLSFSFLKLRGKLLNYLTLVLDLLLKLVLILITIQQISYVFIQKPILHLQLLDPILLVDFVYALVHVFGVQDLLECGDLLLERLDYFAFLVFFAF